MSQPEVTTEQPKPLVLVVDDEPQVREMHGLVLKRDFEVETAPDAGTALRRIGDKTLRAIDAVLTDWDVPGKDDGARVVRASTEHHPPIRAVVITGGHESPEETETRIQQRCSPEAVLRKPCSIHTLLATMRRILGLAPDALNMSYDEDACSTPPPPESPAP